MDSAVVVVRYHEIALKKGNRGRFVRVLENNLKRALRGTGAAGVRRGPSRILIPLATVEHWPEIRERLRRVFGVANFLLSREVPSDLDAMARRIASEATALPASTFAVRCKRNDAAYPVPSPEVCRVVGRAVQEATGWAVDLTRPERTIHIEILPGGRTFFSMEKVDGPGGLPVGSSGTVVGLLSGGIDSPVAIHRMMRRGCRVEMVHFHGAPFQSRASQDKCRELMEVLVRWQPEARLHLVPFGHLQRRIVTHVPRPLRVVLYRRMMMRIASGVAAETGAEALVTGESLGQVASQTLPNLAAIEDASSVPVLRPLIGMDKQEITDQARALGTYSISILPDEDCCQLFVPRHPATRASLDQVRAAEAVLPVEELVAEALAGRETLQFFFPPEPRGAVAPAQAAAAT